MRGPFGRGPVLPVCRIAFSPTQALSLPPLPPPPLDTLHEQTARWCRGELSNFDYIMALNDAAGWTPALIASTTKRPSAGHAPT